jgi:hypothetical protein
MKPKHWLLLTPCLLLGGLLPVESAIAQVSRQNGLPDIPIPPATEARPATSVVSAERARNYASPVQLYPGRSSVIDFSATGEIITYVQLSDLSEIVYDTNAPIDTGAARTIILRPIQPLYIEGTTRALVPNMVVSTIDAQGNTYTYIFDLHQNFANPRPSQDQGNGIAILPAEEVRETQLFNTTVLRPNVIRTELGDATLDDIERGLEVAIAQEYTAPDDPVVYAVEQAIARARNGTPLRTAASELGLDMAVLVALGEMGIESGIVAPEPDSEPASDAPTVPPVEQPALTEPVEPDAEPATD